MHCRACDRQVEAFLRPLWATLFKQDDGTVNIHDLIGDLYKFAAATPAVARRLGEDIRDAPEFAGKGELAAGGAGHDPCLAVATRS